MQPKYIATISFAVTEIGVYLATKRLSYGAGSLATYGGKVKHNESIERSAIREIKEESTAIVSENNLEKVAIAHFFEGERYLFECHIFLFREWQSTLSETREMGSPHFYEFDSIPLEEMWGADRYWVPLIFKGEKIEITVKYSEGLKEVKDVSYKPLEK